MRTGTARVEWHGMPVDAARPVAIAEWAPELPVEVVRRTERALAAVLRAADRQHDGLEVAARLLLRAEGLASSAIEGLRVPAEAVALFQASEEPHESGGGRARAEGGAEDDTAGWVADNLAVVQDALEHRGGLTVRTLHAWHRRLMRHAHGIEPRHVGRFRDALGWVGGANPRVAVHVAAPPDLIAEAMADLLEFVARTDLDPVTQAAVAHAQFETIHPYADGNGRLGRLLIGWLLVHRLGIAVPPPLSLELARDVGGYQAGLTLYRQGDVAAWIGWFSDALASAAVRSAEVLGKVAALRESWLEQLSDVRADAAVHRLVELLPAHPALSAPSGAAMIGVSRQAAATALAQLAERGIVTEVTTADAPGTGGRPRRWFVAAELLALLGR